jgi:hypothetical protein
MRYRSRQALERVPAIWVPLYFHYSQKLLSQRAETLALPLACVSLASADNIAAIRLIKLTNTRQNFGRFSI